MKTVISIHRKIFVTILCGYRKNFSAQTALLGLAEKWKVPPDKMGYVGAVRLDLSKAFDTITGLEIIIFQWSDMQWS